MNAFISYSHRDDAALERLHTHLAVLRREGLIRAWFDRDILAGAEIDADIAVQLESSELFLLLVSPDFLASDYCVEREMGRALERHCAGDARVIPIIIEPCEWTRTPLRSLKALPRDGIPINEWPNENRAYLDVVQELRRILDVRPSPLGPVREVPAAQPRAHQPSPGRYRVQRDFDEIDRGEFREAALATMRDCFERGIADIDAIDGLRGRFVSLSANSFTCTVVNGTREHGTAHITVHGRMGGVGFGDISYVFSENAPPGTANGGFTVDADEYELFLSPLLGMGRYDDERLTPEAAASHLWDEFVQQVGITRDSRRSSSWTIA